MDYTVSAFAWKISKDSMVKINSLYPLKGNESSNYVCMCVNCIVDDDVIFLCRSNKDLENRKIYYCIKTIVPDWFKKYEFAASNSCTVPF